MFSRPRSYSGLYGIQRGFLITFYLISAISVFWLIFYLLYEVLKTGGAVIIPVAILYLVFIVLGYSILQVVSYIPANLAGAFDPIKNEIASGRINTLSIFAGQLSDFMVDFFDFAFFDIESSMVHIDGSDPAFSVGGLFEQSGLKPDKLMESSAGIKGTSFYGKTRLGYIYIIPLEFGEKKLGYIAISTRQKLWKVFIDLLDEFENDFVDDQVVHVKAGEARSLSVSPG